MAELITALPEQLYSVLQREKFLLLSTLDVETGAPNVHAISWIYAKDLATLRFAVDARSRIVSNLQKDSLKGVPFKPAYVDVDIRSVQDVMFYGARIVTEPEYEKNYAIRATEKLDGQVFGVMKKALTCVCSQAFCCIQRFISLDLGLDSHRWAFDLPVDYEYPAAAVA
ncbi:hypothetical protein ACFQZT_01580 [Paenibacillus sp. GCM10027628]|uniref:hypothetical protein n=1 Tax=Paenibacillus sp. GCM10027628 TaxID=3273413 RepID=UPI0036322DD3